MDARLDRLCTTARRATPLSARESTRMRKDVRLLGHHDLDELLVVDLAVTVNVRLADHLVDLLVGELLAEVGHDVAKLSRRDEAVAVLVEDAEGLLELLLGVRVLHLAGHQGAELREVNGAVAVGIDLVDHVLQLRLGRVLAERAHDGAELLGGDRAVTVLVEEGEGLLELGDLLLGQLLVTHDCLFPSPSLSKREKASLNSAICSSVSCSSPMITCFVDFRLIGQRGTRKSDNAVW